MEVGKAIFKILSEDADVSAIVGKRVRPNRIEFDEPLPAVSYHEISEEPNNTKYKSSEFNHVLVQISCFATTKIVSDDLGSKVRTALDYISGTFNGVNVAKVFFQDSDDLFDERAGEFGVHYKVLDFKFNISSTIIPFSSIDFWRASSFYDDGTYYYYVGEENGSWRVERAEVSNVLEVTIANVSNNSGVTTLSEANTNYLTLNYS